MLLSSNIQETRGTGNRKNRALAQINNISRQQIIDNNNNSRNNGSQRQTADQLAMRRLQRDFEGFSSPKTIPVDQHVLCHSATSTLYSLPYRE
ncbi:hypothetical protein AVEN_185830-1 [Araneus ventricosus]|uniref:Uncharacterized protein n=1 Tax=Araneus ventricosus TaxID=182803 RepID=A0A4Y2I2I6_ARAVE|nr:hypothetical protein AVEN_185830-1 [Araneus ventricosus]